MSRRRKHRNHHRNDPEAQQMRERGERCIQYMLNHVADRVRELEMRIVGNISGHGSLMHFDMEWTRKDDGAWGVALEHRPRQREDFAVILGGMSLKENGVFCTVKHGIGIADLVMGEEVKQVRGYVFDRTTYAVLSQDDIRNAYAKFGDCDPDEEVMFAGEKETMIGAAGDGVMKDMAAGKVDMAIMWVPPRRDMEAWAHLIAEGDWDPANGTEAFLRQRISAFRASAGRVSLLFAEIPVDCIWALLKAHGLQNTSDNRAKVSIMAQDSGGVTGYANRLEDLPGWGGSEHRMVG